MFDLIGKTLGPYRIVEQIGAGGMATVYRAYQPGMDRYVAVKILPPQLARDQNFVKRFQREARAVARLEHTHILPVYDYGEAEGVTYLVIRYIQAGTLKTRMLQGPIALDEVSRLIGQVGSALDYAHRMGVIHRDVKPSNILIDPQGDAYLTDFGLAHMLEASQELTATGVGVGTPAYMSPEQGQGVKVDHRSDLYSLGVILYEMVTGRVPFEAETPMAVVLKHITAELPLPRAINPSVPEAVERVILKALAKDPAHRFQTAGEMTQALAAAVRKAGEAPAPQPAAAPAWPAAAPEEVSLVTRVQQMWARPPGKAALLGVSLAAIVALGYLLSQLNGELVIVGPGATATSAPTQVAAAPTQVAAAPTRVPPDTAVPLPTRTPRPTQTTGPVATPVPTDNSAQSKQGEWLTMCANAADLCIVDRAGRSTALGLAEGYRLFPGFGFSPDGLRIAFTACPLAELRQNPNNEFCHDLFILHRPGSEVTPLVRSEKYPESDPSWSPDGDWIAFGGWALSVVRSDGSALTNLIADSAVGNVVANAWSPDSRSIAFVSGNFNFDLDWGFQNEVSIINRDGSGWRTVFSLPDPKPAREDWIVEIAWSPDGQSLAIRFEDGRAYLISADCQAGAVGCRLSDLAEIPDIPPDWLDTFHPQ